VPQLNFVEWVERRSSSGDPPFLLTAPVRTACLLEMNSRSTCRLAAGIGAFASDLRAARALPGPQADPSPRYFRDLEGRRTQIRTRTEPSKAGRGLGRTGLTHYHLRYHLWVGVRRDSSGTNGTATKQKAHRRDQTGPDGT
jgi:hypothetical protein